MDNEITADSPSTISSGRVVTLLVLLGIVTTVIFSLVLLHSSNNYQEVFNFGVAKQTSYNPYTQVSADDPMPLYYLVVHSASHWITPSIQELRIFSWLIYLLILPMAYIVGRRATDDRRVGLLTAVLIGLSPFVVWYSSRATTYVILLLVTLINAYFYIGILQHKKNQEYGYILSGLLGIGLHYFFGVVLLTQLIFFMLKRSSYTRMMQVTMGIAGIVFLTAFVIWLRYSLLHGSPWMHLPYTGKPSATNAFILFVQFLFGFQSVVTTTLIISFWPLLVVLALLAVQKYMRPPDSVQYFAFAAFIPVLVIFFISWIWKPLYLSSYFIVCLPPFMLLVAWYLVVFDLKALSWARTILVASMALMLFVELLNPQRALVEDYLGLAAPVTFDDGSTSLRLLQAIRRTPATIHLQLDPHYNFHLTPREP
jgi:4-amino-4-deoxy-L-arabinose transferase-like glycosyltransferase